MVERTFSPCLDSTDSYQQYYRWPDAAVEGQIHRRLEGVEEAVEQIHHRLHLGEVVVVQSLRLPVEEADGTDCC